MSNRNKKLIVLIHLIVPAIHMIDGVSQTIEAIKPRVNAGALGHKLAKILARLQSLGFSCQVAMNAAFSWRCRPIAISIFYRNALENQQLKSLLSNRSNTISNRKPCFELMQSVCL